MQVVSGMDPRLPLTEVGAHAQRVERLGYDALHVPETINDPFVVTTLAVAVTERLALRTGVALAFVRSPMSTALAAWSLAQQSVGRFDLGLGSQIRPNIEQRYGMAFDRPVARLEDHVAAVRACFAAFESGDPLEHRGTFHQLTRLQPEFCPDPLGAVRQPDLWLGAVGDGMVALAGRVADGVMTHPTTSHPVDLRQRFLPALRRAASGAGRPAPALVVSPLVATGRTSQELDAAIAAARRRLGFLYSTPAYRPTLELLGHDGLGPALRTRARAGDWDGLDALLPDDLVEAAVPMALWADLPAVLSSWYDDLADAVLVRPPTDPTHDDEFAEVVAAIR